jgi:hypothetical protein
MSTQQPCNQIIAPAYNGGSPIYSYNYDVSAQGGVYTIQLCSVPTYNNTGTWITNDVCCLLDGNSVVRFFLAIANNTATIPLSTPGWQTAWVEIYESDLQTPYCATTYYVQTCAIDECFKSLSMGVFCDINNICNKNMCEDQCQMNFYKLMIIDFLIDEAIVDGDYDALTAYYNLATTLCKCSPCNS